jgi:hypothetical protein
MHLSSRRNVLGATALVGITALSRVVAQEQLHAKGRETSLISTVRTGKERTSSG